MFKFMIKADDDVIVAMQELIELLKQPFHPPAFIVGRRNSHSYVIRAEGSKWLVGLARNSAIPIHIIIFHREKLRDLLVE